MDRLKRKKTKKRSCKKNKENVLKNAEMLFKIIIKAFEDYVFMHPYRPDNRPDHELTDTDQNDSDQNKNDCDLEFYTPKEVTTRDEISDFEIKGMFENEDEITPGDMPDLESDESAKEWINQRGQGLKVLKPNQLLNRLPISLAQLKTGNNSEKLKNEISQLLYSLYRSKKLTKIIYKNLINIIENMETIFKNTENGKKNEPHKYRLALADKLNLKDSNKNMT